MALNRKMSSELKALLEQQAEMQRLVNEAERDQKAKEAYAAKAAAKSGAAYAGFVLDLYDMLELEPEHSRTRKGKGGGQVEIAADPNDEIRLGRLRDILEQVLESVDRDLLAELKLADAIGRDERRDERESSSKRSGAKVSDTRPDGGIADEDEDEDEDELEPVSAGSTWMT